MMRVHRFVVLCALLGVLSAAAQPSKLRVLYPLAGSHPTAEDSAAIAWLKHQGSLAVVVVDVTRDKANLRPGDVMWVHLPDSTGYRQWIQRNEGIALLRTQLGQKGGILLTGFAALLPYELELEERRPQIRIDTIRNDGLFDKKGFQSLRGHPIFTGLFGGEFVWNPDFDQIMPSIGYFDGSFPAQGKVVGVEKSYVFVRENRKVVFEYGAKKNRVISVGSSIYFAPKNHLRANLERFIENCLLYAGGKIEGRRTYWRQSDHVPRPFTIRSKPLTPSKGELRETNGMGNLILKRSNPRNDFFDVAGRRTLIMGKENGGLDEVWVHPFRVLRDFEIGIIGPDSVSWLRNLPVDVEVTPHSFRRLYATPHGKISETVVASISRAGGFVRLETNASLRLLVRFRCDLRWMWPYDANALGELHYAFDEGLKAVHVKDSTSDFWCVIGGNASPKAVLVGQYERIGWNGKHLQADAATSNQVYAGFLYDVTGSELTIGFVGTNEGSRAALRDYRAIMKNPGFIVREAADHYARLLRRRVTIQSPDEEFNRLYSWAIVGTDRFFATTPGVGSGLLAGFATTARGWNGGHEINGRPGYAWYFGRDAAWSGFAINDYGDVELVRRQLEFLQAFQDPTGKIFHEISTSGVVHYDAADATPLYVMLAAHYLRASGDMGFIRKGWKNLEKAMEFMLSTDTDGDHLIENTNVGHGWVEGGKLFGAHSTLYLSALWWQTLKDMSYICVQLGRIPLAKRYADEALVVQRIINEQFWNETTRFFNYGKFRDGSYNPESTILPAIGMYFGLFDDAKVSTMLETYAGNGFSADWGVRILSSESPLFNPTGYHYGSVWPLFTGWTALGEYEYGNSTQGFTHIMNNLYIKNHWALGFVEEVMSGAIYTPSGVCPHQCWSETNILHPAITSMIGWKPDAPSKSVTLKPRFPLQWDSVHVAHLRVGNSFVSLWMKRQLDRTEYRLVLEHGAPVKIFLSPELPLGMTVNRVQINGMSIEFSREVSRGTLRNAIPVALSKSATVVLEHTGGIGVLPIVPRPSPGDSSMGYRLVSQQLQEDTFTAVFEGMARTELDVKVKTFDKKIVSAEGAVLKKETSNGSAVLSVSFEPSETRYVRRTVKIQVQ